MHMHIDIHLMMYMQAHMQMLDATAMQQPCVRADEMPAGRGSSSEEPSLDRGREAAPRQVPVRPAASAAISRLRIEESGDCVARVRRSIASAALQRCMRAECSEGREASRGAPSKGFLSEKTADEKTADEGRGR